MTWRRLLRREVFLCVLIVGLIAFNSVLFPSVFPKLGNFSAILRGLAFDGIMVCGMMLLLIGGTFDLSVGGIFSMTGVITGWLMKMHGAPVPAAIATGLLVACAA